MEKNLDSRIVVMDVDQYRLLLARAERSTEPDPDNELRRLRKHVRTFNQDQAYERYQELSRQEWDRQGIVGIMQQFEKMYRNRANALEVPIRLPALNPALKASESGRWTPTSLIDLAVDQVTYAQWLDRGKDSPIVWIPATLIRTVKIPVDGRGMWFGCRLRLDEQALIALDWRYPRLRGYKPVITMHRHSVRERFSP